MAICPICEKGTLKKSNEKQIILGVNLGNYPMEKCTKCEETFTNGKVMREIEKKEKGIWGLNRNSKI